MAMFIQALIDGLMIGGVYAMVGVGLSLAFGVMRIVNWAHGSFLMLGMTLSYLMITKSGLNPFALAFVAGVLMFGLGFLIQRFIFNSMLAKDTSKEPANVMVFTLGISMFLINLVQMLFGANPLLAKHQYSGKTIILGEYIISVSKLVAFILAVIIAVVLYLFLQKSETGRAIRGISQNRFTARLMGVDVEKIYCVSFGIALGVTGIAGGLLSTYMSTYPTIGDVFGFKAFVIVVLGGKGSVVGALVGGLIIGIVEKVCGVYMTDSYAQLITFLIFVMFLLFKPSGLFGKETA